MITVQWSGILQPGEGKREVGRIRYEARSCERSSPAQTKEPKIAWAGKNHVFCPRGHLKDVLYSKTKKCISCAKGSGPLYPRLAFVSANYWVSEIGKWTSRNEEWLRYIRRMISTFFETV